MIGVCGVFMFALIVFWGCAPQSDGISYSEEIKPLLNQKCLRCHGGIRQQGGFSLLFEEEAFAPTESGKAAIIRGNANSSELIRRVKESDPEVRMPQEGEALTMAEIELLEKWINQGAKWDEHWSYRELKKPDLPPETEWTTHPIDHFIYAILKDNFLEPSGRAKPHVLVRRLGLDIIGLPIPQAWAENYLKEPTSDNYEKLVDSLLASPHFGERWAAVWLDLARYADSQGYEKDQFRSIWKYRDWVISAFNKDMSFDQFTVEQLAGDMLPDPTKDQLIATAFHRNTMTNTEGGTEDEEYRSAAIIDRVNTTFEVWQGTTMSCVQCHSHPYDPFSHKEYYQILDFFNQSQDADLDSEFPFDYVHMDTTISDLDEIAKWIQEKRELPGNEALDRHTIRELVFPRLFADLSDGFNDILIRNNGGFSTWSYNANNLKNKQFYLLFEDIDITGLTQIGVKYSSNGDDALLEVRLDDKDGRILYSQPLSNTKGIKGSRYRYFDLDSTATGVNNLLFQFVNTTNKLPDGMVAVEELELVYNGERLPEAIRQKQDQILDLYRAGIMIPVMRERPMALKRNTHIYDRGNYQTKGEPVEAGLPAILTRDGSSNAHTRLDLASWLVSDRNSLTPRVIVNRFWEQIFGYGIVRTLEDFGTQGIPPTHPKLLEYLAWKFSRDWTWSVKRLLKEIVLSETYQQSSATSREKLESDPNNYLLSRGPRIRLSAEQIRDQALAVSGLLNTKIGGPSVMPPQPSGIWQVVYNNATWEEAYGDDRYRRGIYTFWRRTTPYPSMVAFDSPSREVCVSRRIRTNTPIQALVTLNDPAYLEIAEHLGRWISDQEGTLNDQFSAALRHLFYHEPNPDEVAVLLDLYESSQQPQVQLISEADKADLQSPYTVVANAILNLDVFLTKS